MSSNVKAGGAFVEIFVKDKMKQGLKMAQQKLQSFARMASMISGAVGGISAGAIAGWGVKLAADAETAQVGFEVMLGSAEAAKQMVADLQSFADRTPLEFSSLQDAARTLLNFGVSGDQIMPMLQMLGDVSGGDAEKLQRLALAFGQASGKGRLMGQEVLQMVEAGFNPLQFIAARTGESMLQLTKRMEKGGVSIAEVQQAFADATGPGGRFFGMLDKMGLTLEGRWSTLKDTAAALAREIGTSVAPVLKTVVDAVIPVIQWMTKMAKTMPGTFRVIAVAVLAVGGAMTLVAGAAFVLAPIITAISTAIAALPVVLPIIAAGFAAIVSPLGLLIAALAVGAVAFGAFALSGRIALSGLGQQVFRVIGGMANYIGNGNLEGAWQTAVLAMSYIWDSFAEGIIKTFSGAAKSVIDTWQGVTTSIANGLLDAASQEGALGAAARAIIGTDMRAENARKEKARLGLIESARKRVATLEMVKGETNVFGVTEFEGKQVTGADVDRMLADARKMLATHGGDTWSATQDAQQAAAEQIGNTADAVRAAWDPKEAEKRTKAAKDALDKHVAESMDIGDDYWSLYEDTTKKAMLKIPTITPPSMIGGMGTGTGSGGTFSGAVAGLLGRMGTTDVQQQQLDAQKETNELLDDINKGIEDAQLAWG